MEAAVTFAWLALGCACGALAATGPLRLAAAIVAFSIPMSGTMVFAMGGDPILFPLTVALGFIARHALTLLKPGQFDQFLDLSRTDIALLLFAAYCAISGLFFPGAFEGRTVVYPQVFVQGGVPLGPWQVSVVQIAYLVLGVWTYLALRQGILRSGMEWIVVALMIQAALFGGFGLLQALMGLAGKEITTDWIVNNTGYARLTQVIEGGFTRVTSVFIEASYFGYWATGALAFCYALYINRILPAWNLALVAMLGLTLLLSTSSTSYFGLLFFTLTALVQAVLDNDSRRRARGVMLLLIGGFFAVAALIVLFSANSGVLGQLRTLIENMTINKGASGSAAIRTALADSALQNAHDTYYLGAGYGTLRSSGLIYQLIGTVGAPGTLLFAAAMAPLALRAFKRVRTGEDAVASAGGFALICALGAMAASGSDLALPNMLWVYAALAAAPLLQRARAREARRLMEEGEIEPAETAAESAA